MSISIILFLTACSAFLAAIFYGIYKTAQE
jgi:hypothetical protein